jgi:2-dehydro-3-deoxyphosphooctonate aldolase (KDO 8-P synthase)
VPQVIAGDVTLGGGKNLALIAGPCVIESERHAVATAEAILSISTRCKCPFIFKASFDKGNRTSIQSFRGPGLEEGLRILKRIKNEVGVPILTDIHECNQAKPVAEIADVIQIPAYLCRQTDLLLSAAATGRIVNIKKGQFLSPKDMKHTVEKLLSTGNDQIVLTERGSCFGYNNLVVDMRSFPILRSMGHPVVFDVTHSLQLPGAGDGVTAGQSEFIEPLAAAGVAAGVDGVFMEVHEDPYQAKSDAQNALPLDRLEPLVLRLMNIHAFNLTKPIAPSSLSQ